MRKNILLSVLMICMVPLMGFGQNPEKIIVDSDIPVGSQVTFHADTTYILSGMVFVDSLATLTIEPGTVIKAESGQGNEASGLVITRFARIFAEGTACRPIIFTSVSDNLNGNLTHEDRGLWGGVVMLGRASTNNQTEGGLKEVEGVNEIVSAGDTRAMYGGDEDTHSSGVFKYVSIRHSGINVGDQAGNEIQGLTLGGVGSGTVIDYVESFASADDGFEWFGGTVCCKHMVSAFNEDDSYDTDEGFRGKGQYWFAIQAADKGGRVAEMDGATGNEYFQPYSHPILANCTYIGAGIGATPEGDGAECIILRDNTGVEYYNSIFTDYDDAVQGAGLTIEDVDNTGSKTEDSRMQFEAGNILFENNLWYGFGAGNAVTEFIYQDFAQAYFQDAANANLAVDPQIRGISRTTDGGLDPRPEAGSPAFGATKDVAADLGDSFFDKTDYMGAFGSNNWLLGWTALDQLGYLSGTVDVCPIEETARSFSLLQNYPNPFNPSTTVQYAVPARGLVRLTVFNTLGQKVATLVNEVQEAGLYMTTWNAGEFESGMYFLRIQAGSEIMTKKMTLIK